MRKRKSEILLAILPIYLLVAGNILKYSLGEYFSAWYDPSYVYLINSLNFAQLSGFGVGHIDHPGTPVQVFGAIVVKLYHTLSNGNIDIAKDVFSRPEDYLLQINRAFLLLNSIALLLLGIFVYRISRDLYLSVFASSRHLYRENCFTDL